MKTIVLLSASLMTAFLGCAPQDPVTLTPALASATSHDATAARPRRSRELASVGLPGIWPVGGYQPFDEISAFNTIAAVDGSPAPGFGAALPNSQAIVSTILANGSLQGAALAPIAGTPAGDLVAQYREYGYPYYYSIASEPVYSIHCTRNFGLCPLEGKLVHIPAGALPELSGPFSASSGLAYGPSGDAHMAVLDLANNVEYDTLGATVPPANASSTVPVTWNVGFGGYGPLNDGPSNPGGDVLATGYDSTSLSTQPYGATHSDSALTIGTIRPADLLAPGGTIAHALAISAPCLGTPGNSHGVAPYDYVAQADNTCPAGTANAPQYGMRIVLNATQAEISALGMNAFQTSIWTAMATYGGIISDANGASGLNFQFEDPLTYTTQGGSNLWDGVAAQNGYPASGVDRGNYNATGTKWYFYLAPASAAAFIKSRLYVANPS